MMQRNLSRKRKQSRQDAQPIVAAAPAPLVEAPAVFYDRFLLIVLLVAMAVRLAYLGRAELWQDELGFLNLAHTQLSASDIWRSSWNWIISIGQLPLAPLLFNAFYRLIEAIAGTVGPFTPGLARIPAVLFGMIGVWSVYRLSARVLDLAAARLVAVMMAICFFPVYYSREAYCYAQIIALTPLVFSALIGIVFDRQRSLKIFGILFVCLVALLYSHLGALMIVAVISASLLVLWIWSQNHQDRETARGAFAAGLICAAALLCISPYIMRFATENKAHTSGLPYSFGVILNDAVCKLFLGELLWADVVSWIVFLAGITSLFLPHKCSRPRKLLGWVTLGGLIAITWATHRSQYLSVRYFSPVAPLVLIVMGQGVYQIAMWLAQLVRVPESRRTYVFIAVAAVPLAIHGLVYTPALLRLTEKSVPFGAVARWINDNLAPGTPYLMESAYEIRWVGNSFPTPNNRPASPYVHGSHEGELQRLRDLQIAFMNRFPEAPFVESAHHNWNLPEGLWDWPHRNFRQHAITGNPEKLKRLIRMGIDTTFPHEELSLYSYRIDIYYNTWTDRVAIAKEAGRQVLFTFDGWEFQGQPVSQQETLHFRFLKGYSGSLKVVNIGDQPLNGSVTLNMAFPGPAGQTTAVQFRRGSEIILLTRAPTGQFAALNIPLGKLPPGETVLTVERSATDNAGEGLVLLDADWKTSPP